MAHSGKQRVVLAAIAATSLLVAALLEYDIARRVSSPASQFARPMPATGSTGPNTSTSPLALSVSISRARCPRSVMITMS